jgi:5'-deoxynucleotidase YfbR-like HD superfamily hydrolase
MRIVRFSGAYEKFFWPVGLHCLFVADLGPENLAHHLLLHDAAEACVADVPRPMKTNAARAVEGNVQARIYNLLGLNMPNEEEKALIHEADVRAGIAEGLLGCGSRGYKETVGPSMVANKEDNTRLLSYLDSPNYNDFNQLFSPVGYWARKFESRVRTAIQRAQAVDYKKDNA